METLLIDKAAVILILDMVVYVLCCVQIEL